MPSIRRLGEQFAADKKITREEAQVLVAKARADGKVTAYEKTQLREVLSRFADSFDAAALAEIRPLVESGATGGKAIALAGSAAYRPVYLNADGAFTVSPDGLAPRTPAELGDALFRAAELADDVKGNVFADAKLTPEALAKVLGGLKAALATAAGKGMDPAQAIQLRASCGTVLLHLAEASAAPLQGEALEALETLIRGEPDRRLRENLVFHLSNSPVAKAGEGKAVSDALLKELAPLTPPYEKWFANGNRTVNLSWSCGGEFYDGIIKTLTSQGFTPEKGALLGQDVLVKTYDKPGVGPTTFRIAFRRGGANLLADTGKSGVHIMGYDGHSNWGRNMTGSIRNGPKDPSGGDGQLFIYNLCVGKGVLDQLKTAYPNLQAVATFGASYLDTDFDGMCSLIAERADWNKLDQFFNRTDGYAGRNNFVTPIATQVREKVLDRDHDGQADYLDKHFNYNTFAVPTDTRRELQPVKQDRPAEVLDGTKVNVAAQMLNTVSEFSAILDRVNPDSKVVADGWFEPGPRERIPVRFFKEAGPEGAPIYRMQVSARYAHMSEETLRAVCVYEFDRYLAMTGQLPHDAIDAKLHGLLSFAQMLGVDESSRDDEIWTAFLDRYGFPPVGREVFQQLLSAEHHDYAGNPAMLAKLRAMLTPEIQAVLNRPEVGEPRDVA